MDIRQEALKKHYEWKGKLEIAPRTHVTNSEELSLAYTPGVAEPCLAIRDDYEKSYLLTRRANMVAVITDGSAILGLGDIGPEAGMPVMEGKCVLFKEFAGVDAFPLCVRTKDVDELVRTIYLISGSFGGINLEDIAAPRCFEVERRLKEICDIPVFHDDQHGTAVVVAAALLNALKVMAGIPDELKLISPSVIQPIQHLKVDHMGNRNPRLHTDEVLIALSISAATNPVAELALAQLPRLSGCEVHSSVMLAQVDTGVFKKLGMNLTCEPHYQTKKLYHK